MVLALEDKWVWDSWYAHDGAQWHCFFLQADKSLGDPELRHWHVNQGHATSTDLKNWTYLGISFGPTAPPAWDDYTTWTGSVIRDDEGLWHLFYSGTCRAEEGKKQRIGHATSKDLHTWTRVGDGLCLDLDCTNPDYEEYEPDLWWDRALRDPWVMRDPDGQGWRMYVTTRSPIGDESYARGSIGMARSDDLINWTWDRPIYVGQNAQLEVPQVFQMGGRWYCLLCNDSAHWSQAYRAAYPHSETKGTHYLVADHIDGPWDVAPGPYLDGASPCQRYAARIVQHTDGKAYLLGFLHDDTDGNFVGQVSDPQEVRVNKNALLELI